MANIGTQKIKKIVARALEIREKAGFTTERIEKRHYNMPYIPDAVKRAAKELKTPGTAPAKRTKRVVKTAGLKSKSKPTVKTSVSKMNEAKSEKTLNGLIKFRGKVVSKREMIKTLVNEGGKLSIEQVYKLKDVSRVQFNRMTGREQDDFEKRRERAGKIPEYQISGIGNTFHIITKTEYDFAKKLQQNVKPKTRIVKTKQLARRKVKCTGTNSRSGAK